MKRFALLATCSLLLSGTAALADGKVYVTLPDMAVFAKDPVVADRMLRNLYNATVLSVNCPGASLSDAEHSLLTDSFDLLAYGELKLSTDELISRYEGPAFAQLDDPDACIEEADLKEQMLNDLRDAGGSTVPLADQEQAYHDWRALMDAIRP
ncbi:hypothetical protein HOY34_18065 [Xinfangfangia sp. D13-10-4-6]|uniref:hypothetical protein n=1 Tax=Pseudogemmobacter hezensis TaxID=2737662 RepID=UPI00155531BB|nr:hypothetical protein [Pseudogemmobacter hezensis]NPD17102.1 hypothetical protein [Pseudogemmobacter hezensis]